MIQNQNSHNYLNRCRRFFQQNQDPFMVRVWKKLVIQRTYMNIRKTTYNKSVLCSMLNAEKFKLFVPREGTR